MSACVSLLFSAVCRFKVRVEAGFYKLATVEDPVGFCQKEHLLYRSTVLGCASTCCVVCF